MDRTELLEKLEKIQRLMENAGTPGEAEAAAAAFSRLLLKHNIDARDLENQGHRVKSKYILYPIQLMENGKPGLTWRVFLVHVLAKYNFCEAIRHGAHGARMFLVGEPENIAAIERLFFMMVPTFERLAELGFLEATERFDNLPFATRKYGNVKKPHRTSWKNSFFLGVPRGLTEKLETDRRESMEDSIVNAVVVAKDQELMDAVNSFFAGLEPGGKAQIADKSAYKAGFAAGRNYATEERVGGSALKAIG